VDQAIERLNQVVRKKPGGTTQAAAEDRLPYLTARRDAQTSFDKGDFATAAKAYATAVNLDPFAIDAASKALSMTCFRRVWTRPWLCSTPSACAALPRARQGDEDAGRVEGREPGGRGRGERRRSPASAHRGGVLWRPLRRARLGRRRRILATSPVDQARFVKLIEAMIPAVQPNAEAAATAPGGGDAQPRVAANQTAAIAEVLKDIFHLEVAATTETRDLAIKRAAAGTLDSTSGSLDLEGADKQVPVLYDGRVLYLPAKLSMQAGKYEIRSVQDGKVLSTQEVVIQAGLPQKVKVTVKW